MFFYAFERARGARFGSAACIAMDRAIKLALDLDETLSKSKLGAFLNYSSAGRWVDSGRPRSSAMGTTVATPRSNSLLSDRQDSSRLHPRREDVALALDSLLTPRNSGPAKPRPSCPPPVSPRHAERSVLNRLHGAAEEVIGGAAAIHRSNVSCARQSSGDPSQWTEEQLRAYLRHAPGSSSAASVQTREQLIRRACRVMHGATPSDKTSCAKAVPNDGKENADTPRTNSNRQSRNHSSHIRPLQPAAAAATTTTTSQTEPCSGHCRRHHRCLQPAPPQSARQQALVPPLSLEEQLGIQLTPRPSHRTFEQPPGLLPPSAQRARTPSALSLHKTTSTETKVQANAPEEPRARVEAWARGKDFRAMVATLEEVGGGVE